MTSTTDTMHDAVELTATRRPDQPMPGDSFGRPMFAWDIELRYEGRSLIVQFYTGKGLTEIPRGRQRAGDHLDRAGRYFDVRTREWTEPPPKVPTWADVAYCLAADARGVLDAASFEEWAEEYGYDTDSRRAEDTYRKCLDQAAKLRELFGADFDAFTETEWDG